jgi:sugar (pentulose or hexulose) kinase
MRNEQDTAKRVKYWVNAGDFLAWHLTGELITDPLNAGKCLYDDRGYADEMLGLAGLKTGQLPSVAPIGTVVPMRREFMSMYGMPDDAVFVLTSYDAICAVLGGTDGAEGSACDVSGTVTSIRMLVPQAHSVHAPALCQAIGVEGLHVVGCSNNLGGGIVEWYKPFIRADVANDVYAQMDAEGRNSPAGARGVIFLPYLMGERAPFYLPEARGTFFGMGRETGPADLTRAVLESTAYVARDLVDVLRGQGVPVSSLTVSGGLARIDLVNQIKADVSGIPVRVPENFESTAMGAFLLTAVAARIYPGMQAASRAVRFRQIIQPNFDNHAIYTKAFELFRQINQALLPSYALHAELRRLGAGFSKATLSNL